MTGTDFSLPPAQPLGRGCPSPTNNYAGASGQDFGTNELTFGNSTLDWFAGSPEACVGLVVTVTSTRITIEFGNEYGYQSSGQNWTVNQGNQFSLWIDNAPVYNGTVVYT